MDPRLSPPGGPVSGGEMIIFEGHLEKISDILSKWERRYFVLSRTNLFDPSSIELAYYKDSEKKTKQKKTIDLQLVVNVSPVQKSGNKENVFALDMKGKHVLLKASNILVHNVWLAKLLECCSKDHLTYHVTIPAQPMCSYFEGLVKLSTPAQVKIVSPVNGAKLVSIDFNTIRRFGCEVLVDYDIVWFETCGCKGGAIEQFFWFAVPSGIEAAHVIVHDIKKSVELTVRSFLIQEEGNKDPCQTIYISRPHYGCNEYPASMRQRIMQSSLMSLATSPRCETASLINRIDRTRRSSGAIGFSEAPTPGGDSQRTSVECVHRQTLGPANVQGVGNVSPRITPRNSSSPSHPGRTTPLSQLKYGADLNKSASQRDFDSGVNMEGGGFDQSRHSAPSTYNVMDAPSQEKKLTLGNMGKRMSLDEVKSRPQFLKQRKVGTAGGGRKLSDFSTPPNTTGLRKLSQSRDSANGSVGDLLEDHKGYNHLLESDEDRYNHLAPPRDTSVYDSKSLPGRSKKNGGQRSSPYDHLSDSYSGMSLKDSMGRDKKPNPAYVM